MVYNAEEKEARQMILSVIWVCFVLVAILYGTATGQGAAVGAAALEGAGAAVELCLAMAGAICLWSGVMTVMERAGISAALARALGPALRRLFPSAAGDRETMSALAENVSANFLGLGNAATPAGIRAAGGMRRLAGGEDASNDLCRLVVLNTASVQLLPTTVAAVRAAAGAANAFDILPAVWLASAASVTAGLLCARALEGRRRP